MNRLVSHEHGAHTPYAPPLLYRITGRLNAVVWRLPLPRRAIARLSMLVYRNPPMAGELVLGIVEALHAADVRCWISGGWGVDALIGRQTRLHRDLDVVIEDHDGRRAVDALRDLGYWEWYSVDSDTPLFARVVLHDHPVAGHAIDLHPLDLSIGKVQFTDGAIEGRAVPCLSVESQVVTHSNYRKRWRDRADLARLRKLREGSATTLIIPVSVADDIRHESACEAGMPAHITVLHPFLGERAVDGATERALAALLEETAAFDFTLKEIGRFPNVVYLAPEPAGPFVALTEALVKRWPKQQPYGGAFEEIVPHVTLAYGETPPSGAAERLPISARAQEVWLMTRTGNRWVRRRSFALNGSSH
jgi:2'-5' RNA ligase